MRKTRRNALIAAVTAVVLSTVLGVPALVSAEPGPVPAVLTTSSTLAATLVPAAAADARQALETARASETAAAAAAAQASRAAYRPASSAKPAKPAVSKGGKKPAAKPSGGSQLAQAQSILSSLKAKYPRYLGGVTVSIGSASGYQAVAYYKSGRIVISPTHKASLQRILSHEIWHIIDWRDNGRIDWRENVPPANAGRFR